MKIEKKVLDSFEKVYAVAFMEINNELNCVVATEGFGPCKTYNSKKDWAASTVWEGPGGTMNIVPIPGRKNEFYATQDFTPTFQAKESKVVHAVFKDGAWVVTPVITIPYLHRFDVIAHQGSLLFIGATLCEDKKEKEDWSKPGKVYFAKLSEDLTKPFTPQIIMEGITKNHGFCRASWKNRQAFLVSGSEGVFAVYPPLAADGVWETEQLLDHEVSDMAVCDLDNDGELELATIEPFHGSSGVIYKQINGKLTPRHKHEYEFGHVVWGGNFLNRPSFIIGGRKGNRELNWFFLNEQGKIERITIDNTGGPSNIAVYHLPDAELVLAANREVGEAVLYTVSKD
ncbi:MAG: hypothetical protein H6Q67_1536 [Firmicutes bacterium]|nr:hypothetical protein [Bacillota bacterium]